MSDRKKGAMVAVWLGLLFMAAGLLTMLVSIRIPHYTADITEITDTYTTRQLTGSGSKRRYNESVTVIYTDNEGNQKEAAKVRVKRSSESQLPQIGDKIEVKEVFRKAYSNGLRAKVNCYGANDVTEGVAIMWKENVDVSITGNSTNPTRFQHPVAGTYKKERTDAGKKYFSVASGGGTGRTLHPDNMAAGPASYGMTDTMGRMHSDAQFAGSSSVPAHVEMMGFLGAGNNPMVGMTVAVAVAVQEAMSK
jgi:hypothetical protein